MNMEGLSLNDKDDQDEHPPWDIEDILEHVFGFLNLNEIKLCRLVKKTWNVVGTKLLRRNSQIVFNFTKLDELMQTVAKSQEFTTLSEGYKSEAASPFAAILFRGILFYPSLNHFVENFEKSIRELTIMGDLQLAKGSSDTGFDLNSLALPQLHKLHICQNNLTVPCRISLKKICFIKDLYLERCTIGITGDESRLSAKKVNLTKNNYTQNEMPLENFVINKYFDLRFTDNITLDGADITLDFSDCANEKIRRAVYLSKVSVINWNKCDWNISILFLEEIPFVEVNGIEVKEIICTNTTIDICVIKNRPICRQVDCHNIFKEPFNPFNSPDVQSAHLHDLCIVMLPFCFHMDNLREIEIANNTDVNLSERERVELEVQHLPIHAKIRVKNYILYLKIA